MSENQNVEGLIKNIIKERGLQQKFICEKIKISQEQFSQCMRGKRKFQVIEFLALCSLLNLDLRIFDECISKAV